MSTIFQPFDVGEIVYFNKHGSGFPKYTRAEIVKIGIDLLDSRPGRARWYAKIKVNDKISGYWSCSWFSIATTRTPKPSIGI